LLWLAAQTYLLCLVSFIAGAVVTALVLRNRKPAADIQETPEILELPEDLLEVPQDLSQDVPQDALPDVLQDAEEPEASEAMAPLVVKATRKSMRYHTSDSPYYNRLKDDLTFPSIAEAEEAGFTAWNTRKTPATT
jgi:hypothetical protein